MSDPTPSPAERLRARVLAGRLPTAGRLLVAVSGGVDSTVLLHILHDLAVHHARGWELIVAHVNHGLRGDESDGDEGFVAALAASLGLRCEIERVDLAAQATTASEGAARALRYDALERMRTRTDCQFVVLGHTRNDQAETVLLHLLRGAGTDGLAGMLPRGGTLLRPFLTSSRSEILEASREHQWTYREDSSNTDRRYLRNRLRLDVMPALESLQPHASTLLSRTAHLVSRDADYLRGETEALTQLADTRFDDRGVSASRAVWQNLHPALGARLLLRLLRDVAGATTEIGNAHVERVMTLLHGSESIQNADLLPGGVSLTADRWRFTLSSPSGTDTNPPFEAVLPVPGDVGVTSGHISARVSEQAQDELQLLLTVGAPTHLLADADALGSRLLIRTRRPGDRIRPVGMPGSQKLQDMMVNRKVPMAVRDALPVVENDDGVVWVAGLAVDRRVMPTAVTSRLAHLVFFPRIRGFSMVDLLSL